MPIITLTSDWGYKDHYSGAVKGAILRKLPDAVIVDISHAIPVFNIEHAAYVVKNAYREFPDGTIHILAVNTEESENMPHTVVCCNNQFFIGSDNGIFSLIFQEPPDTIIELTIPHESDSFSFSTLNRFVHAAERIARGAKPEELGIRKQKLNERILFEPVVSGNIIKGHVIYIDNYENIITNIRRDLFNSVAKGRPFSIIIRTHEINAISNSYQDVKQGEVVALFTSGNLLEIAINEGNAGGLLGAGIKDLVRIEFF